MNKSSLVFSALMTCVMGQFASAAIIPGWDRPVAKAELKIIEATGVFAEIKKASLMMNSQDGAQGKTSFVFTLDQQALPMVVTQTDSDACGSVIYTAVPQFNNGDPNHHVALTLTDNTHRRCRDARQGVWEVKYEAIEKGEKEIGRLFMAGSPDHIMTIQKIPVHSIQPIGY